MASDYLRRAAELLIEELKDERGALDFLRQGVVLVPLDEPVYEALLSLGTRMGRLDAVDAQLARLIDEAIDSNVTVALLRRRAALLETLDRSKDATQVLGKLLQLRPDDAEAAQKLRVALRAGGRFQELLVTLNKQLQRSREPELRLALLKDVAQIWEHELRNRWEAIDAWKAVRNQEGDDADAAEALERLGKARTSPGSVDAIAPRANEDDTTGEAGAEVIDTKGTDESAQRAPEISEPEARAEEAEEPSARDSEPQTQTEAHAEANGATSADEASESESASESKSESESEVEPAAPIAAAAAPEAKAELPKFEEDADDLEALDAVVGPSVEVIEPWNDNEAIDVDEDVSVVPDAPARRSAPAATAATNGSQIAAPPPLRASVPPPYPRAARPTRANRGPPSPHF